MKIGERIRSLRTKNNFTQKELAKLVGLKPITIQSYELDKRTPNLKTLNKIATALGVTVNDLLWPTNEDKANRVREAQTILKNAFGNNNRNNLISNFDKLNELGQAEACKRVEELTELSKYTRVATAVAEKDVEYTFTTLAAHDDDLTDEEKEIANEIAMREFKKMDEENYSI